MGGTLVLIGGNARAQASCSAISAFSTLGTSARSNNFDLLNQSASDLLHAQQFYCFSFFRSHVRFCFIVTK
jgi:hypothetical protein